MTKYTRGSWIAAVLVTAAVAAGCEKNSVQVLPSTDPLASRIKFFNFGVNAPGVNFYADAVKMTAVLSSTGSEATTGVAVESTPGWKMRMSRVGNVVRSTSVLPSGAQSASAMALSEPSNRSGVPLPSARRCMIEALLLPGSEM